MSGFGPYLVLCREFPHEPIDSLVICGGVVFGRVSSEGVELSTEFVAPKRATVGKWC